MAKSKETVSEDVKVCPFQSTIVENGDDSLEQLEPEQARLMGVIANGLGMSVDQYHRAFSHGASFARAK
jgi:hypothetical protein